MKELTDNRCAKSGDTNIRLGLPCGDVHLQRQEKTHNRSMICSIDITASSKRKGNKSSQFTLALTKKPYWVCPQSKDLSHRLIPSP